MHLKVQLFYTSESLWKCRRFHLLACRFEKHHPQRFTGAMTAIQISSCVILTSIYPLGWVNHLHRNRCHALWLELCKCCSCWMESFPLRQPRVINSYEKDRRKSLEAAGNMSWTTLIPAGQKGCRWTPPPSGQMRTSTMQTADVMRYLLQSSRFCLHRVY